MEHNWQVLLLQEFTAAQRVDSFGSSAGHQVYFTAPSAGCRACCIVIHSSLVRRICSKAFVAMSRGVAVGLHWEGWNLLLVSAHLAADRDKEAFYGSLFQLHELCNTNTFRHQLDSLKRTQPVLSAPIFTVIGVDAQASLDVPYPWERDLLEDASMGPCGWKGRKFMVFCRDVNLRLTNTFDSYCTDVWTCHFDGKAPCYQLDVWTCHFDGKAPCYQLDYILTDLPCKPWRDLGVRDSAAALTDHRPVLFSFEGPYVQPRPSILRRQPLPIRRMFLNPMFSDAVREEIGWGFVDFDVGVPKTLGAAALWAKGPVATRVIGCTQVPSVRRTTQVR